MGFSPGNGTSSIAGGTDVAIGSLLNNDVLTYDASVQKWKNKPASAGSAPDATTSSKGSVKLAGDLAGTADLPSVIKINGVAVAGSPSAGQVLIASNALSASWSAPTSGNVDGSLQTIQLRRGTAAQLNSANPTLTAGEIGVELDTGKHKVGDGSTNWVTLPYVYANASDLTVTNSKVTANTAAIAALGW